MSEVQLLQKISDDLEHIKIDLEEIKDLVYPAEEKITKAFVAAVQTSEKHYKEGKFKEAKTKEELISDTMF